MPKCVHDNLFCQGLGGNHFYCFGEHFLSFFWKSSITWYDHFHLLVSLKLHFCLWREGVSKDNTKEYFTLFFQYTLQSSWSQNTAAQFSFYIAFPCYSQLASISIFTGSHTKFKFITMLYPVHPFVCKGQRFCWSCPYVLLQQIVALLMVINVRKGEALVLISGHDSPYWRTLLPFSYATVSGAIGSCSVLFAKSL